MQLINIGNARDPEQVSRMKTLQAANLCYFCKEGSLADNTLPRSINEGEYWYVMKNDFPLEGSIHHYLIVPHRHVINAEEISEVEAIELYRITSSLKLQLGITGYSMFVRSGDMTLTGATLAHVHWHFIMGGPKPEGATLEDVVPVVIAYKKK